MNNIAGITDKRENDRYNQIEDFYNQVNLAKAKDEYSKELRDIKPKKTEEMGDCQTCNERKYIDGSNDPGVSFKSAQNIDPAISSGKVYSHEREHYIREETQAKQEGKEIVSNDIRIFYDICPECGKQFASGGETQTVTKGETEMSQLIKNSENNKGTFLDVKM